MKKPDAIALLMKTPPNKLKRRPMEEDEAEPMEDDEEGYDSAGAVAAAREFFEAGKSGDFEAAYEAFKNLKAICESEEE